MLAASKAPSFSCASMFALSVLMTSMKAASKPVSSISSATFSGVHIVSSKVTVAFSERRATDIESMPGCDRIMRSIVSTQAPQVMPPIWKVAVTLAPGVAALDPDANGAVRSGSLLAMLESGGAKMQLRTRCFMARAWGSSPRLAERTFVG
jgi:hypothetical protein